MTPDERRHFLISRGWSVARIPVADGDRLFWSMTENPVRDDQKRGPLHFVDLRDGRWRESGKPYQDWLTGPWHELVEDAITESAPDSGTVSRTSSPVLAPEFTADGRRVKRMFPIENLSFFVECVAAGFEIVDPAPRLLDGDTDLGNREARRAGVGYTLLCATKSIMGPGCRIFKLSDFHKQHTTQQIVPKFVTPAPKPVFFRSDSPVATSGNTKQKGLFA